MKLGSLNIVMPGLDPAIHTRLSACTKAVWIAGSSPATTSKNYCARSITLIATTVDFPASMVKPILSPGLSPLSSAGGTTG